MDAGQLLRELSEDVVASVHTKLKGGEGAQVVARRSRDLTLGLDDAAESALERGLVSRGLCARVVSEERKERVVGVGEPGFTLVFDPVDGSANAVRGLGQWVTAIAYSPLARDARYPDFTHAAVRTAGGELYRAQRGAGAFQDDKRLRCADAEFPGKPMFSVYLSDARELPAGLASLIRQAKLRAFGSVALDLCYVAAGYLDGIADVRDLLSAWDVMAAALVLEEAGGVLTGRRVEKVSWAAGERGLSMVGARTTELHARLLGTLL